MAPALPAARAEDSRPQPADRLGEHPAVLVARRGFNPIRTRTSTCIRPACPGAWSGRCPKASIRRFWWRIATRPEDRSEPIHRRAPCARHALEQDAAGLRAAAAAAAIR